MKPALVVRIVLDRRSRICFPNNFLFELNKLSYVVPAHLNLVAMIATSFQLDGSIKAEIIMPHPH